MRGTITAIEEVRVVDEELNVSELILTIDMDQVYAYDKYTDLVGYLNKEVTYVTRVDFVDGIRQQVLCEISEVGHVYTYDKTDNVKLYTDEMSRPYCNFKKRELKLGEFYPGSVAYLSSYEEGSSARAHWFDCVCLDAESKVFYLRIFARTEDYDVNQKELLEGMIGSYIMFDLEVNRFGFQCKEITGLSYKGGTVSPEVGLARTILENALSEDPTLNELVSSVKLLDVLYDRMDGEPGYNLVRMASEIYFVNAMSNVSGDVDVKAIKRAVFCSRLHFLSKNTKWSKSVFNINRILRSPELSKDKELLMVLDVLSEERPTPTKIAYIKIRDIVDLIIKIRRGEDYEKDFIDNYNSVVSKFGGLL